MRLCLRQGRIRLPRSGMRRMLPTTTSEGEIPGLIGICSPGSLAYTADGAYIFMLNNRDQWKLWVGNSSDIIGE